MFSTSNKPRWAVAILLFATPVLPSALPVAAVAHLWQHFGENHHHHESEDHQHPTEASGRHAHGPHGPGSGAHDPSYDGPRPTSSMERAAATTASDPPCGQIPCIDGRCFDEPLPPGEPDHTHRSLGILPSQDDSSTLDSPTSLLVTALPTPSSSMPAGFHRRDAPIRAPHAPPPRFLSHCAFLI